MPLWFSEEPNWRIELCMELKIWLAFWSWGSGRDEALLLWARTPSAIERSVNGRSDFMVSSESASNMPANLNLRL